MTDPIKRVVQIKAEKLADAPVVTETCNPIFQCESSISLRVGAFLPVAQHVVGSHDALQPVFFLECAVEQLDGSTRLGRVVAFLLHQHDYALHKSLPARAPLSKSLSSRWITVGHLFC